VSDELEALLDEQLSYYRARAPEYTETALIDLPAGELANARDAIFSALDAFHPRGDVLELACGPGTWTTELLKTADSVTAVDGAPEMLRLAEAATHDQRVRFVHANVFTWEPDRQYDVVFFGFWLSHVPLERFEPFWSMVARCLRPGGRVAFVDDAYRTPEELIDDEPSSVIRRELKDGTRFRAIKVAHTAADLERRLLDLGWEIRVREMGGPFFWGSGGRTEPVAA
jgi:demethylmenaquinone methyltransferase/2-methoxy-6-polyprenyl-1,4-benzoquinol methylase